ncbi:hypothetical protein [Bounagaea algeriensis]
MRRAVLGDNLLLIGSELPRPIPAEADAIDVGVLIGGVDGEGVLAGADQVRGRIEGASIRAGLGQSVLT